MRSRNVAAGAAVALVLVLGLTVLSSQQPDVPGPRRHKVETSNRDVAERLQSGGARMIGDYGSYVLLDVDEATLSGPAGTSLVQRDEYNQILLNTGAIETANAAARAEARAAV